MNARKLGFAAAISAIAVASGCGNDGLSSGQKGTLSVRMTDAPGAYEKVNITFDEIAAHIDGSWQTVESDPQTIDLLKWNNGASIEIGRADLQAGHYTQIRLKISSADVVIDGATHAMTVPSGSQTGLKLGTEFTIEPNMTFDLVIDFDASRSVVTTGPPQAPTGYQLKPTVRAVPRATTGAISGVIVNPANGPVAFAISNNDTVTSSPVAAAGVYTLAFLPAGTYRVAVSDSMGAAGTLDNVVVTSGSVTAAGNLTLQQ